MNKLQQRLIDFAARAINLGEVAAKKTALIKISDQLIRSSSSIGANYAEAQSSFSTKDYHFRVKTSLKEARETEFWLAILKARGFAHPELEPMLSESLEIIKILTSISNKTRPSP